MDLDDALQLINPSVRSLEPYHLKPDTVSVKLNQNENPFDWPASIKEEVARFCVERPWNRYPNFIPDELRGALADYAGVSPGGVIAGNGSNEMLLVLLLSLAGRGRQVIICQPTFTVYRLLARSMEAAGETVPLTADLQYDVDAICAVSAGKPGSVLILCSPNNPTGNVLDEAQLRRILGVHKGFCILDQAYVEFGGFNAVPLLAEHPNLVITRTFSKAFAGAGLRLGYMLGNPSIIAEIAKVKLPYNVNFFSEHVALVLLRHRRELDAGLARIVEERGRLLSFLRAQPFAKVYPSAANFVLVATPRRQELFDALRRSDILVRDVSSYPMLGDCLRISVGSPEENRKLENAVASFFDAR